MIERVTATTTPLERRRRVRAAWRRWSSGERRRANRRRGVHLRPALCGCFVDASMPRRLDVSTTATVERPSTSSFRWRLLPLAGRRAVAASSATACAISTAAARRRCRRAHPNELRVASILRLSPRLSGSRRATSSAPLSRAAVLRNRRRPRARQRANSVGCRSKLDRRSSSLAWPPSLDSRSSARRPRRRVASSRYVLISVSVRLVWHIDLESSLVAPLTTQPVISSSISFTTRDQRQTSNGK